MMEDRGVVMGNNHTVHTSNVLEVKGIPKAFPLILILANSCVNKYDICLD